MTGIGDEHDLDVLVVGLLHPFEDLVVDDPLARGRPARLIAAEQEVLVEPVGLVVASGRLGLLARRGPHN